MNIFKVLEYLDTMRLECEVLYFKNHSKTPSKTLSKT